MTNEQAERMMNTILVVLEHHYPKAMERGRVRVVTSHLEKHTSTIAADMGLADGCVDCVCLVNITEQLPSGGMMSEIQRARRVTVCELRLVLS